MSTEANALINEAFQLLRAISFITPAVAFLLNLINPRRREGREEYDRKLFAWILGSFILLIVAGVVDVSFLIFKIAWLLLIVEFSLLIGLLCLLWATVHLFFAMGKA
jgi:hypothetical protein